MSDSLRKALIGARNLGGVDSIKWGLANESKAIAAYVAFGAEIKCTGDPLVQLQLLFYSITL
jgi:hypothetical protein